jgi:SAM-dependent methyltransferase
MTTVPTVPVGRCPVCGGGDAAPLHVGLTDRTFGVAPGRWTLVRCRDCHAARLDPRPADNVIPGLYASYYTHEPPQPHLVPPTSLGRAMRALRNDHVNARLGYRLAPAWPGGRVAGRLAPLAAIAERGVRSLPAGVHLLDVGCGNGTFVAEATAAGWHASGIDLDQTAVAAGRAAGLDLAVDTIEARAAREPGRFDAVTLSHVIEHVAEPIELLRAAHGLLRPGGHLWVATPNLAASGHAAFGADWAGLDPPRHLVLFDADSLARALRSAGFDEPRALRPTPTASAMFRVSAAVQAGVRPYPDGGSATIRVRARALLADARAQLDPARAEELLVLARA